jgi:hypothetical protein|nr:MAG TPA: hypothetical protein [Caudoviricetes sp.]
MEKISTEIIMSLSEIIDKMGIANELKQLEVTTGDEKKDLERLGQEVIILIFTKLYKVKEEVYDLISKYRNISIEEAKQENAIGIFKEILNIDGVRDFLS